MNKTLKISFAIILFVVVIVFCFYGTNINHYTTSQINLFLSINNILPWEYFWLNVTALGDAIILFPFFSFFIFKNTRIWAAFFGAIPLASILSHAGKIYFSMPRPAAIIDVDKMTVIGDTILRGSTSLPSGHTITIFTLVSAIIYILLRENKINYPAMASILLVIFASVVAISRVAVGAHWPFDLILGAVFGIFGGISGAFLTFKYKTWWHWMAEPKFNYIHIGLLAVTSISMVAKYPQLAVSWLSFVMASIVIIKLFIFKNKGDSHK